MTIMIKRGEFDYNDLESLWVLLPYAVYGFLLSCESRDIELLSFVHWLQTRLDQFNDWNVANLWAILYNVCIQHIKGQDNVSPWNCFSMYGVFSPLLHAHAFRL
jgi:hypothetical protein